MFISLFPPYSSIFYKICNFSIFWPCVSVGLLKFHSVIYSKNNSVPSIMRSLQSSGLCHIPVVNIYPPYWMPLPTFATFPLCQQQELSYLHQGCGEDAIIGGKTPFWQNILVFRQNDRMELQWPNTEIRTKI